MLARTKRIALTLLLCGAAHGLLHAQFVKQAQVGFRFLENPVSAEVVGRGTVGVVNTMSSNSIFWNPALLSWMPQDMELSINHTRGIADINYNAIAGGFRLGDVGVLGFSVLAMDYGTFYGTVRSANSEGYEETGTFTPTAMAVGLAFSQKVSTRFSFGVHAKYARQDLGDAVVAMRGSSLTDTSLSLGKRNYAKDVLALDVGAYYDFLYNGITFGAVLQNISRELTYESEAFPLPFAVSFGVTIRPLTFFTQEDSVHSVIVCVESRHPRDFGEKVKVGVEYGFMQMFTARVGYASNYDERAWSAGVGVRQVFSGFPIRLDYAYEPFGILGSRHFISLVISR
jgi:long-subunit fatty acid transport protein